MSALVKTADIVVVHHGKPFSNTLAIAEGVGMEHKNVIALVRKFQTDFEEFGERVAFQTRPFATEGGEQLRVIAELNEDQATYLMTLFKNTAIVRAFKIRLVKAFRKAINELSKQRTKAKDPEWQKARVTQQAAQLLTNLYVQSAREEQGKTTSAHHYMNEELLLNELVTGVRESANRDTWTPEVAKFALAASKKNAYLVLRGLSNKERRKELLPWAAQSRPSQKQLLEAS